MMCGEARHSMPGHSSSRGKAGQGSRTKALYVGLSPGGERRWLCEGLVDPGLPLSAGKELLLQLGDAEGFAGRAASATAAEAAAIPACVTDVVLVHDEVLYVFTIIASAVIAVVLVDSGVIHIIMDPTVLQRLC